MPDLMPDDLLSVRSFLEGALPRQQVIHGAAETVNIGANVHAAIDNLFRRDVVAGADDVADLVFLDERGRVLVEETRQAHVQDFHGAGPIEQQIAWLDVAMDKSGFVRVLEPKRGLANVMSGTGRFECAV